jgi:hypothetical protein
MVLSSPVISTDNKIAKIDLTITNNGLKTEKQAFSYYLNLDTETNVRGWSVTANGIPMMYNNVRVTIPSLKVQSTPTKLVIVVTCNANCHNEATILTFRLTGICYEDIISPAQYAFSISETVTVQ